MAEARGEIDKPMGCKVRMYEDSGNQSSAHSNLVSSTVQLIAIDESTRKNCCAAVQNGSLAGTGKYGADLTFSLSAIVYEVAIADLALIYAGTRVSNLNGNMQGDIDVVLFKIPPASIGIGATATNAAQMRQLVLAHRTWSPNEKLAILNLMDALSSLRGTSAPALMSFIDNYSTALARQGIGPNLF
jgi:hypothetical protein